MNFSFDISRFYYCLIWGGVLDLKWCISIGDTESDSAEIRPLRVVAQYWCLRLKLRIIRCFRCICTCFLLKELAECPVTIFVTHKGINTWPLYIKGFSWEWGLTTAISQSTRLQYFFYFYNPYDLTIKSLIRSESHHLHCYWIQILLNLIDSTHFYQFLLLLWRTCPLRRTPWPPTQG